MSNRWHYVIAVLVGLTMLSACFGGNTAPNADPNFRVEVVGPGVDVGVICDLKHGNLIYTAKSSGGSGSVGVAVIQGGCR